MSRDPSPINVVVLVFGGGTSLVAVLLVLLLNKIGFSPMGFYVLFIVPLGALLVGLLAGTGYAVGSYLTNVRVRRPMFFPMFLLGVATFFLAHYVTFADLASKHGVQSSVAGFGRYLRFICENTTYIPDLHERDRTVELGYFGYALHAIECAGFAFGGVVALLALRTAPYCGRCQLYKRAVAKGFLSSEGKKQLLKGRKTKDRAPIINEAVSEVTAAVHRVLSSAADASLAQNLASIQQLAAKPDKQSITHAKLELLKCPRCDSHSVTAVADTVTVDGGSGSADIGEVHVEPADDEGGRP